MKSLLNRSPFHKKPKGFLEVENSGDEAKILLYDEIGYFGVNSKQFAEQMDAITARTIHLHINSPGGDVFDGMAIANMIRAHDARVVVHVDGLAASIASIIAISGDYVRMADNAMMMIHDPAMLAYGNASEMRKSADLLDKVAGTIVSEYTKRTKKSASDVRAKMEDETWFTSAEAMTYGLCDAIDHAEEDDDGMTNVFDLSIYRKTPAALLKEAEGEPTVRELEAVLRDAGLSRAEARRMVSVGRTRKDQRDAAPDDVTSLANSLGKLKQLMTA